MSQKVNLTRYVLITLALFLLSYPLFAHNLNDTALIPSQYHQNFAQIDGLPSSEIYDITQDNQGYLWFATDRGLARFDGETFQTFGIDDGIPDNVIFNFFEKKDGSIWCSTLSKKVFYFKNASEGFHTYPFNNVIINETNKGQTINNVTFSQDGNTYFTFINSFGYLEIDKNGNVLTNSLSPFQESSTISIHILKNAENLIYIDADSLNKEHPSIQISSIKFRKSRAYNPRCLWFPKQKKYVLGIGRFNLICDENFNLLHKRIFDKTCIYHEAYDSSSFWIGFQYGGASQYDLNGNLVTTFLPEESVTKMFFDHEGGKWYSTLSSGLFYTPSPQIKSYTFESYPTDLAAVGKDSLFIAFHNGNVLLKKEDNQFHDFYQSPHNSPSFVNFHANQNILVYGDNALYMHLDGTNKINNFYGPEGNFRNCSDDLTEQPTVFSNICFFSSNGEEIKQIRVEDNIRDITKTDKGFFIATNNGLYSYVNDSLSIVSPENKLLRNRIYDVDYKHETLYMATLNTGLVVKKADTVFSINQSNGLLSNNCNEVYIENDFTIWVGTSAGLSRVILYPNNKFDVQSLSIKDGLNCTEINDIEIIEDEIWITSKEGLFNFKKSFLNKSVIDNRKWLDITEIKVNDSVISKSEEPLEFSHLQHTVSFEYNSISFKNPGPPKYRYRLMGATETWTTTNAKRVNFSQLPYGAYTFELGVMGESGNWIETTSILFLINTPFWHTWWFIILITLFCLIIIYLAFKFNLLAYNKERGKQIRNWISRLFEKKQQHQQEEPPYIKIKDSGQLIKLLTADITYFKSAGNYVEIYTDNNRYTMRTTLAELYTQLPNKSHFVQLHRSFYVSIQKVTKIGSKAVYIAEIEIPVSRTYAKNLANIKF